MADDLVLDDKAELAIDTPDVTPEIEPTFELDADSLAFIEQSGGVDYLKETKDLYDGFIGKDGQFDGNAFADQIKGLSDERYKELAWTFYDRHKNDFFNQICRDAKIAPTDISAAREWVAAGRPSDGINTDDLDPDDPKDALIIANRKELAEIKRQQAEFAQNQQQARQQQYQQQVYQEIGSFENDRLGRIASHLGKLNLGTDDLAKEAKTAIEALAQAKFAADQSAKTAYSNAIKHLEKGEKALAVKLYTSIDLKIDHYTAQAAKFIGDLLQAKRDAQGATQKTISGRTDISPGATGTTKPTNSMPNDGTRKRGEFSSMATMSEKLRALQAAGKLGS